MTEYKLCNICMLNISSTQIQWNLLITATQKTGEIYPLCTADRYTQVNYNKEVIWQLNLGGRYGRLYSGRYSRFHCIWVYRALVSDRIQGF